MYGNTFTENTSLSGANAISLTLEFEDFSEPYYYCSGVYFEANTFTRNIGVDASVAAILKFYCVDQSDEGVPTNLSDQHELGFFIIFLFLRIFIWIFR